MNNKEAKDKSYNQWGSLSCLVLFVLIIATRPLLANSFLQTMLAILVIFLPVFALLFAYFHYRHKPSSPSLMLVFLNIIAVLFMLFIFVQAFIA